MPDLLLSPYSAQTSRSGQVKQFHSHSSFVGIQGSTTASLKERHSLESSGLQAKGVALFREIPTKAALLSNLADASSCIMSTGAAAVYEVLIAVVRKEAGA